ncbi:hypothetical protein ACFL47_03980 [Candidatus Latescibacterota bacterium]
MTPSIKEVKTAMKCRRTTHALMSLVTVLFMVIWASGAFADAIPPRINMNSHLFRFEPGAIKAQVQDDTEVRKVTLYYRAPGEVDYNSIDMKRDQDIYYRNLRRELGIKGSVEYYILAQDNSGNAQTEPEMDAEENPRLAAMDDMVSTSADEVVLSSPEPGTLVVTGNQMVIVTFYKTDREVDMKTVRIKIDDRDRTREADIVGNVIMWEPRRPMRDGSHLVEVYAYDTDGNVVGPNLWSFRVKTKLELPMGMTGNFYMGIQHDDRSDNSPNVPLWNNKIDVGLAGEQDWMSWEAGVMFSSEESSFLTSEELEERQPINRYFLNARTRHWRLRVGDSNPNFSELSLKGVLVRGVNAQFKSNRFNAQFVYGYNKRDIQEQLTELSNVNSVTAISYIDDDTGETVDIASQPYQEIVLDSNGEYHVYEFRPGTFRRNVMAFRFDTLPIKNRFFRWDFGMNVFAATDDSTTLDDVYVDADKTRYFRTSKYGQDLEFSPGYQPKKNWVGTFETSLRFNNNRSVLSAEFGGSLATENMYGILTEEIEAEIPDAIPTDIFPVNGSTQTSFDKLQLSEDIGKGLTNAILSVYKFRFMTPVPIPMTRTSFRAEAYRIPTHYISLGNPHQKTDIGGYKVNLKTRIIQDQVSLNLEYNTYADNLDSESNQYANSDSSKVKDLTKDTNIASVSVSLRPKLFPEYAPNISLGYRTYTAENDLDFQYNYTIDTVSGNKLYSNKVNMATNTLMFTVGGTLPVGLQKHVGTLSVTSMDIADDRPVPTYQKNDSNNMTMLFNVNSTINPLPLQINASIGRTGNTTYMAEGTSRKEILTDINMLNLSGSYKWFRDKRLKTTAALGYIGSANDEGGSTYEVGNTKVSIRLEADYKISRMASVGGMVKFIKFTDDVNLGSDYTEPVFGINLRSNF